MCLVRYVLTLTDLTSPGGRYNERNETHETHHFMYFFFNLLPSRFTFSQCFGARAGDSRGTEIKPKLKLRIQLWLRLLSIYYRL
jgi:hypothetical protein